MVAGVVRGDRDLNVVKLKNLTGATEMYLAETEEVLTHASVPVGSAGPVGLRGIRVFADLEVKEMQNFVCGANEEGYHFVNVNTPRDFTPQGFADLRTVTEGDICPKCGDEQLLFARGIEVGQIFKLWTKYSEVLGCTFVDEKGDMHPMLMGCYGIGITRTVAAIIEQSHDDKGILWPIAVAPHHALVMPVNVKQTRQLEVARKIYDEMKGLGVDALLDDRDERAGVKFMDSDLMGFPYRITVGKSLSEKGVVEIKSRKTGHVDLASPDAAAKMVKGFVEEALARTAT
jgi:prolyl-tRNA synthetase